MRREKRIIIRISEEQELWLIQKAREEGYIRKTDYARKILFNNSKIEEKINKIYEKECKNG
jgi:hypothetical protein